MAMLSGVLIGIAFLVSCGVAVSRLLDRISAKGGSSHQDATKVAAQILAEANAFRGSRSDDTTQWDGQRRLARPEDGELGLPGLLG